MANRISKVMTRTGDKGQTGLADGSRLLKNSLRIQAIGEIDELNALIGVIVSLQPEAQISACLVEIQRKLFKVGGELALPEKALMTDQDVVTLERVIETFNENLSPLKDFILPGGSPAAAQIHVARTVCRRAERSIVALSQVEAVSEVMMCFINRLSDVLFVLSRAENRFSGYVESIL